MYQSRLPRIIWHREVGLTQNKAEPSAVGGALFSQHAAVFDGGHLERREREVPPISNWMSFFFCDSWWALEPTVRARQLVGGGCGRGCEGDLVRGGRGDGGDAGTSGRADLRAEQRGVGAVLTRGRAGGRRAGRGAVAGVEAGVTSARFLHPCHLLVASDLVFHRPHRRQLAVPPDAASRARRREVLQGRAWAGFRGASVTSSCIVLGRVG